MGTIYKNGVKFSGSGGSIVDANGILPDVDASELKTAVINGDLYTIFNKDSLTDGTIEEIKNSDGTLNLSADEVKITGTSVTINDVDYSSDPLKWKLARKITEYTGGGSLSSYSGATNNVATEEAFNNIPSSAKEVQFIVGDIATTEGSKGIGVFTMPYDIFKLTLGVNVINIYTGIYKAHGFTETWYINTDKLFNHTVTRADTNASYPTLVTANVVSVYYR